MQVASQEGFLACLYQAIGDTVEMLFHDIEKTLKVTFKKKRGERDRLLLSIKTCSLCFSSDLHFQDLCKLMQSFVLISHIQIFFRFVQR